MNSLPYALRRAPIRLAVVILLSLLVAGACYGVSLTPASQMLASSRGGPPAGRGGANVAAQPPASAPAPADTSSDVAIGAPSVGPRAGSAAPQRPPMGRPGGGGGRPASLQRGLPELARNAGVIAVLIVVVAGIQFWLRTRRRPQVRRVGA